MSKTDTSDAVYALLVLIGGLSAMPLVAILNAFVFVKLYGWHVQELFHLPPLGKLQAYGVMLLLGFIQSRAPKKGEEASEFGAILLFHVVHATLFLLVGWIALQLR